MVSATAELTGPAQYVWVAARSRQVRVRRLRDVSEGPVELGDFVLPPATTLVGRVRDANGAPLAGVAVKVSDAVRTNPRGADSMLSGATTNARGIFQVPCVPRTGLHLRLAKFGYEDTELFAQQGSPLTLTMRAAPIVRGVVRGDDGMPVAGAKVNVWLDGRIKRSGCRTDALGQFESTAPIGERYRMVAFGSGTRYMSKLLRGGHDDLLVGAATSPTTPNFVVRAVSAASGESVHDFWVATSSTDPKKLRSAIYRAERNWKRYRDEALIPLRRGRDSHVVVRADGYGFAFAAIPQGAANPLVVELLQEAVVVGRVVDAQGVPVVGAVVRALPKGPLFGGGAVGADPASFWPRTDKDGRYRIRRLKAGGL